MFAGSLVLSDISSAPMSVLANPGSGDWSVETTTGTTLCSVEGLCGVRRGSDRGFRLLGEGAVLPSASPDRFSISAVARRFGFPWHESNSVPDRLKVALDERSELLLKISLEGLCLDARVETPTHRIELWRWVDFTFYSAASLPLTKETLAECSKATEGTLYGARHPDGAVKVHREIDADGFSFCGIEQELHDVDRSGALANVPLILTDVPL